MIFKKLIFRGGITYGKIFHNNEFVFGPAMNEAYRLESKLAESARIIIDEPALAIKNEDGRTIKDYSGQFVFKIEDTGFSYIDYIYDVYPYVTDREKYYKIFREIIVIGLQSTDPRIVTKYEWLKKEYNRAKDNFSELEGL